MQSINLRQASIDTTREKNINFLKQRLELSYLLNLNNISTQKIYRIVTFIKKYRMLFKFCNSKLIYQNNKKVNCIDLYINNNNKIKDLYERIFNHYILKPSNNIKSYSPINVNNNFYTQIKTKKKN